MFIPTLNTYLIVCPLVFLAGFVDSVAGGGGLISIPAYLFAGLPIHMAYGTNKLSSCSGTSVAVWQYSRSGYIHWRTAAFACGGALCGSFLGAKLAMFLSETYLHYCLLAILPVVAVFLIFNRNFGKTPHPRSFSPAAASLLSVAIGLVLGCYDGFFGPGTGTFLVIAFTAVLGQELPENAGNTKLVNLCSNVSALCAYLLGGKVLWTVGIPAALCNIAGNWLGAHLAVRKGASFIRPLVLLSVGMLFINLVGDLM